MLHVPYRNQSCWRIVALSVLCLLADQIMKLPDYEMNFATRVAVYLN